MSVENKLLLDGLFQDFAAGGAGEIFEEIGLVHVLTHQGADQTEETVVVVAPVLHVIIRFLLADMTFKGFAGHIEAGLSAEGRQWPAPVQIQHVFLIQMQVGLGDVPGAVFFGGVGVFFRVRGHGQGMDAGIRQDPVGSVTVFPVDIVGEQDFRLEAPDPANHGLIDRILLPQGIHLLQSAREFIREIAPHRIIADAAGPETVQQFQTSVGYGGDHHANLDRHFVFSRVDGQDPAEPEDLVVRMGHDEQKIRLFRRGSPLLDLGREISFAVDVELRDLHAGGGAFRVGDAEFGGPFRQGKIFAVIETVGLTAGDPVPVFILHLHAPGMGVLVPFDGDAGGGLVLGQGHHDLSQAVAAGSPVGLIVPVGRLPEGRTGGTSSEVTLGSQVGRGIAKGAST